MDILTYLSIRNTSQADFAKALGVSQGLVCQWIKKRRPVAADRCVSIERVTGGAVGRRDLRPDDWQDIWPELTEQQEVG
ncbi:transcriptional regulator [Burkholderia singularis]|uniref:transcriptional regulator n=1 Tax=Burkholderia singularis TaxID=1503053 RepID=UPI000B792C6A|nr:YdaS family helix-turn-helix protein [Burkholderia singularis]